MTPAGHATHHLTPQAQEALRRGNLLEAIKIIRASTGVGLAEAKAMLEQVQRELPKQSQGARNHAAIMKSFTQRKGLSPGEVPSIGGAGQWFVLAMVAVVVLGASLYFF